MGRPLIGMALAEQRVMTLPHEVARMGDALRAEVSRQLIEDLHHYRPNLSPLELIIDWSGACQEGHCTTAVGGALENLSGVLVTQKDGTPVAEGWMDFVHGGGANALFVFWLFLSLHEADHWLKAKHDVAIPSHVWERLPASSRDLCAFRDRYDSSWCDDPKVALWARARTGGAE